MTFCLQQFTLPTFPNRRTVPENCAIKWKRNKVYEQPWTQFSPLKNISKALCGSLHQAFASGPQDSCFRSLQVRCMMHVQKDTCLYKFYSTCTTRF